MIHLNFYNLQIITKMDIICQFEIYIYLKLYSLSVCYFSPTRLSQISTRIFPSSFFPGQFSMSRILVLFFADNPQLQCVSLGFASMRTFLPVFTRKSLRCIFSENLAFAPSFITLLAIESIHFLTFFLLFNNHLCIWCYMECPHSSQHWLHLCLLQKQLCYTHRNVRYSHRLLCSP